MNTAPISGLRSTPAAAPAPAGWAPTNIVDVPATRRSGSFASTVDALRGVTELGNGQPLSPVQVDTLAPALAAAYELPEAAVHTDLENTRLYIGGPATKPGWAITMGSDIYVPGHKELERILSWDGRRWLSHELGHTMQWRRIPDAQAPTDLARMRRDFVNYGLGMVHAPGPAAGAIPRGIATWVRQKLHPQPGVQPKTLGKIIHDVHPMEIEAELHAREFAGLPPAPPSA